MTYALVRAGLIENLIEIDPELLVELPPSESTDAWYGNIVTTPGRPAWVPPEGLTVHPVDGVRAEIGWQWNDGAPAPVVVELSLGEAKSAALQAIASSYAAALRAGVTFSGKPYQIDEQSQGRILARAVVARACLDGNGEWPDDYGWIAMDNSRPIFTAAEFWQFANDAQGRVTAITLNARSLKDAVLAAADIEALEAVDVQGGW